MRGRMGLFDGPVEALSAMAEPVWREAYPDSMRLDLFHPRFLAASAASGPEWIPVSLHEDERLVSFVVAQGYRALLRGRPAKLAYYGWLTTAPDRAWLGFKVCTQALQIARERGYDVVACIAERGTAVRMFRKWTRRVGDLHGPFLLRNLYPIARVLRPEAAPEMLLSRSDRWLLRLCARTKAPGMPDGCVVRDAPPDEERLRDRPIDLQVVDLPCSLPYFRVLDVERRRRIGQVQILDLPMLGRSPIGCVVVERFWFERGRFRMGMNAFLAAMGAEGKGLALAASAAPTWADRARFATVGFLPDLARPFRVIAWATDPERARELAKARTALLPFR